LVRTEARATGEGRHQGSAMWARRWRCYNDPAKQ